MKRAQLTKGARSKFVLARLRGQGFLNICSSTRFGERGTSRARWKIREGRRFTNKEITQKYNYLIYPDQDGYLSSEEPLEHESFS